jgi:hypothetical protein
LTGFSVEFWLVPSALASGSLRPLGFALAYGSAVAPAARLWMSGLKSPDLPQGQRQMQQQRQWQWQWQPQPQPQPQPQMQMQMQMQCKCNSNGKCNDSDDNNGNGTTEAVRASLEGPTHAMKPHEWGTQL